ncbi:calcineurin subunit B-like [Triticum dicoccoides]|uniref:calcineurin subunit B-like n=1 Tax=Triticum dicoccoides TaxID=85692 RepID=UPI00189138D8|nr:calcineurin subunit B-like [Triticum dicoccoides]XP_037448809.1 calcineurin subunit B-like [Triticum dicoccoides]
MLGYVHGLVSVRGWMPKVEMRRVGQKEGKKVQEHCSYLFSQQEIVSLYERFCQLDRSAKGFVSEDEFLSIPEFSTNPLSKRLLRMVDGLNFKEFVSFLSTFSARASLQQKIELIFKVYDIDGKGKVSFKDLVEVLRDLTGSSMSEKQREQVLTKVLEEAGYTQDSTLALEDFVTIIDHPGPKMEVEVPID